MAATESARGGCARVDIVLECWKVVSWGMRYLLPSEERACKERESRGRKILASVCRIEKIFFVFHDQRELEAIDGWIDTRVGTFSDVTAGRCFPSITLATNTLSPLKTRCPLTAYSPILTFPSADQSTHSRNYYDHRLTHDQVLQILVFLTTHLHASTTSTAALISPFFPSFLPELIALSSYLAYFPSAPSSQSEVVFLSIMVMPIGNVLDALLFLMGSSLNVWHKRTAGVWIGKTLRRRQGLEVFSSHW